MIETSVENSSALAVGVGAMLLVYGISEIAGYKRQSRFLGFLENVVAAEQVRKGSKKTG